MVVGGLVVVGGWESSWGAERDEVWVCYLEFGHGLRNKTTVRGI